MADNSFIRSKLASLGFSTTKLLEYLLVAGSAATMYLFVGLRGILYEPFRHGLGLTNAQLGTLMSIAGFVQIFGYVAFGWLQERMNVRKLLTFDMLGYGLTGLFLAFTHNLPFVVLICCWILFGIFGDAMYWPTIQKSIKYIGGKHAQARAFGIMESIRGIGGLIVDSIDVIIFTALQASVGVFFGIKAAMTLNASITTLFGVLIWFKMPNDFMDDVKGRSIDGTGKQKISFRIVLKAIKIPVVWVTGLGSACAYITYICVSTYFVPYLQHSFVMAASLAAVFGIVNVTAVNILAAAVSGIISDKFFKNSASWMAICFTLMVVFITITLMIPKQRKYVVPAMIFLLCTTFSCYLIRAVYYSPLGQYGVPDEISSTAMSIASFFGYSPVFFAYPVFGRILDAYPNNKAYSIIFTVLVIFSVLGIVLNLINSKVIKHGYKPTIA
ncbi:MFS transporter [Bifidobacterium sp. ESL0728]|uniref:MFS transporter n=1 Tax=Bifidobacterium sp. ESL0728 TaxID=2983220 RepID=UPI0023F63D87|nr:MFS transporter [Bifidobacterium sp. ESL0728]WEV59334.1 MFS transporter [Bifidobacterium sp. ESL0728]